MFFLFFYAASLLLLTAGAHGAALVENTYQYKRYTTSQDISVALEPAFKPFIPSAEKPAFNGDNMNMFERALIEMYLSKSFETLIPLAIDYIWNSPGLSDSFISPEDEGEDPERLATEIQEQLDTFYNLTSFEEKEDFIIALTYSESWKHNCFTRFLIGLWNTAHIVKETFEKEAALRHYLRYQESLEKEQLSCHMLTHPLPDYTHIPSHHQPRGAFIHAYISEMLPEIPTINTREEVETFNTYPFVEKVKALAWYATGPHKHHFRIGWAIATVAPFISFARPDLIETIPAELPLPFFSDASFSEAIAPHDILIQYTRTYRTTYKSLYHESGFTVKDAVYEAIQEANRTVSFLFLPPQMTPANTVEQALFACHPSCTPSVHTMIMSHKDSISEIAKQLNTQFASQARMHYKASIAASFIYTMRQIIINENLIDQRVKDFSYSSYHHGRSHPNAPLPLASS